MTIVKFLSAGDIYAQALRYVLVGITNTFIGLGTIYLVTFFWGLAPLLANALGYSLALSNSFILNRRWTFRSSLTDWQTLARFLGVFALAYLMQLGSLSCLLAHNINAYFAQALSMFVYVVIGFAGNKCITFDTHTPADTSS